MIRRLASLGLAALSACASTPPPAAPPPASGPAPAERPAAPTADNPTPAEEWRTAPPAPAAAAPAALPVFARDALENGLTLIVAEQRSLPLVSFALVVRGGSAMDPAGKGGLTSLAFELLGEGAGKRDALAFADAVADLGASFSSSADPDRGILAIGGLSQHKEKMLELLADAALRPKLAAKDFDRIKNQRLANIEKSRGSPQGVAFELVPELIYGPEHPYGHPANGTLESVAKVGLPDVKAALAAQLKAGSAALIAVGDIDLAELKKLAGAALKGMKPGAAAERPHPVVEPTPRKRVAFVHRKGAPQTMVVLGRPLFGRGHADEHALTVTNELYGGSFSSRLNLNLREKHGYTYGARSAASPRRGVGALYAFAAIRTDATVDGLKQFFVEIEGLRGKAPEAEELGRTKDSLVKSLPGDFERTSAAAGAAAGLFVYGLPLDYYATLGARLQAIDAATVLATSQRYLTPESMAILLVGDGDQVLPKLGELQLGEVYTIER